MPIIVLFSGGEPPGITVSLPTVEVQQSMLAVPSEVYQPLPTVVKQKTVTAVFTIEVSLPVVSVEERSTLPFLLSSISLPEVQFYQDCSAVYSVGLSSTISFFSTANVTPLVFMRQHQGVNQLIANGKDQNIYSAHPKQLLQSLSHILSDQATKLQTLSATLLSGDPTTITQGLLASIINNTAITQGLLCSVAGESTQISQDIKTALLSGDPAATVQGISTSIINDTTKLQSILCSVAGESTQKTQGIETLLSGDIVTKLQVLQAVIEEVFSARKSQGLLSALGDLSEPVVESVGSGDTTTTPTITPPANYAGGFLLSAANNMTVNVLPDGSCAGACTAGFFNMETGAFDVPVEWTSPPEGEIRTVSFQSTRYRKTNYDLFIDGKKVTSKVNSLSISINESSPHDEISISVSPMDYQFFLDCDEMTNYGQPRIEVQFYDGVGNAVRSKQFLLEKRSVSGEDSFSVSGISLSATDDHYRDDTVFTLAEFASAKDTAESLLENNVLDWQIDDWLLPPGFEFSGKPFEGVLKIAHIAKAVVRCDDDNTVIVRKKRKYRPIELPDNDADILYDRASILQPGKSRNREPGKGYTAVEVSGYGTSISMPDIEVEESSPRIGQTVHLRVYWGGERPVLEGTGEEVPLSIDLLDHYLTAGRMYFMGNFSTELGYTRKDDGSVEYTNYEIKNGVTSVEKPIASIERFEWIGRRSDYNQDTVEGVDYFFDKNSKEIRTNESWGVARIVYKTQYQRYAIHDHSIRVLMAVLMLSSDTEISVDVLMKRLTEGASEEDAEPVWGEGIVDDNITGFNLAVEVGTVYLDDTRYDRTVRSFEAPYFSTCQDGNIAFVHDAEMGCTGNHYITGCSITFDGPKVTQNVEVYQCKL